MVKVTDICAGDVDKVGSLVELPWGFGIIELVCTGRIAMAEQSAIEGGEMAKIYYERIPIFLYSRARSSASATRGPRT